MVALILTFLYSHLYSIWIRGLNPLTGRCNMFPLKGKYSASNWGPPHYLTLHKPEAENVIVTQKIKLRTSRSEYAA